MHLTIVYDGSCGFCRWSRDWLREQPLLVPVTFVPSVSDDARRRWGHVAGYGTELFIVADDGRIWVGTDAFIMALWTTRAHRRRSATLTGPVARMMMQHLSARRAALSGILSVPCDDGTCGTV